MFVTRKTYDELEFKLFNALADAARLERENKNLNAKLGEALQDRDDLLHGEIEKVKERYEKIRQARLHLNDADVKSALKNYQSAFGSMSSLIGRHP